MGQIRSVRWLSTRTFPENEGFVSVPTPARRVMHWRKRFAPLLLVLAALGAYTAIGTKLPRDHEVSIDLGPAAHDVTRVELTWTEGGLNAEDPAISTQWNFIQGTAPERLRTHLRVADGSWQADVLVDRNGGIEHSSWSRRVYLEGTQVILPLREALR
jgi:hypothetical protein